jgi:hypothetical protein
MARARRLHGGGEWMPPELRVDEHLDLVPREGQPALAREQACEYETVRRKARQRTHFPGKRDHPAQTIAVAMFEHTRLASRAKLVFDVFGGAHIFLGQQEPERAGAQEHEVSAR